MLTKRIIHTDTCVSHVNTYIDKVARRITRSHVNTHIDKIARRITRSHVNTHIDKVARRKLSCLLRHAMTMLSHVVERHCPFI